MRVEFPAEFTGPAGPCVEAMDDGCIDVFHGGSWGRAKTASPGLWAETEYSAGADSSIVGRGLCTTRDRTCTSPWWRAQIRSEEHTSELQSHVNLVCRLLLEKKKK